MSEFEVKPKSSESTLGLSSACPNGMAFQSSRISHCQLQAHDPWSHMQTVYSRKGVVKMEWMAKKSGAHRLMMAENTFKFHFLFSSAGETHLRILQTLKTWQFHISCRKTKGPLRHPNVFFNGCYANAAWIWGGFPIFYCWQGGNTLHWVHKAIRHKNLKEFAKGLSKLLLPKGLSTVTLFDVKFQKGHRGLHERKPRE